MKRPSLKPGHRGTVLTPMLTKVPNGIRNNLTDPMTEKTRQMGGFTWRISLSKWLIIMVSKPPKWVCFPSKWPKWLINGGY